MKARIENMPKMGAFFVKMQIIQLGKPNRLILSLFLKVLISEKYSRKMCSCQYFFTMSTKMTGNESKNVRNWKIHSEKEKGLINVSLEFQKSFISTVSKI